MHHFRDQRGIACLPLCTLDDRPMAQTTQVRVERYIAENEIADGIGAPLSEIAQVVIVGPVDHALGKIELRVASRNGATEKSARALVLKKIGNSFTDSAPGKTTFQSAWVRVEEILAGRQGVECAKLVNVAFVIELTQRPVRADAFNLASEAVARPPCEADPQKLPGIGESDKAS